MCSDFFSESTPCHKSGVVSFPTLSTHPLYPTPLPSASLDSRSFGVLSGNLRSGQRRRHDCPARLALESKRTDTFFQSLPVFGAVMGVGECGGAFEGFEEVQELFHYQYPG